MLLAHEIINAKKEYKSSKKKVMHNTWFSKLSMPTELYNSKPVSIDLQQQQVMVSIMKSAQKQIQ